MLKNSLLVCGPIIVGGGSFMSLTHSFMTDENDESDSDETLVDRRGFLCNGLSMVDVLALLVLVLLGVGGAA